MDEKDQTARPEEIPASGRREPDTSGSDCIDEERIASPPSSIPALRSSPAWRPARSGKWKAAGCGCGMLLVLLLGLSMYFSLRDTVWAGYEDSLSGLDASILTTVPAAEVERLHRNLRDFDLMVRKEKDPYPLIGAFVRKGRKVLEDGAVDAEETAGLNSFLENRLASPDGDR